MVSILASLVSLGIAVCTVMVLIKMYQTEGPLKAVLGFFCYIYAFIWGWMNAGRLGLKNIMLIQTGLWVLLVILFGLGAATMFTGMSSSPTM